MTAAHIRGGITPVLLFFLFLNAAALAVGPAAVQVDRDPRRRLAFRGDGIEDCFRPIVLCRLPTLCGGNDALGLDPYQAPAEHRVPVRRASFVMVALAGWCFLGETPSIRGWIGVLMVAAGVVVIWGGIFYLLAKAIY